MPAAHPSCSQKSPVNVSLTVLPSPARPGAITKRRRYGVWRAIVLVSVHVAMAIHILLWSVMGSTVTPIEPSESMQTLREGVVNAGFIFFALATISTLIVGRFFCGWGCHVVALQDLCSWIMGKIRLRPKPFRSRLLALVPIAMGLYMFAWPVVHREVIRPIFADARGRLPDWLGQSSPIPGITVQLTTRDFWETFAPWQVAIPFLLVCGFFIVYLMGSKAFCTYGCPYAALFKPADTLSVGKIVVNDNCHQCGHCTAACTSNVRVHEEVRDFGKVVDPGCMKCLDCVSVCPNGALSFAFASPTIVTKPKDDAAKQRAAQARATRNARYDVTWGEECALGVVWFVLFWCYRGMLSTVPMLMAIGMAGCASFLIWKCWRLLREQSTRLQSFQLKHKGVLKPAGYVTVLLTLALVVLAGWSGFVRVHRRVGEHLYATLATPINVVLSPGYAPAPSQLAAARAAIAHYRTAASPSQGGVGWSLTPDERLKLAYMHLIANDPGAAESDIRAILNEGHPKDALVFQLAQIMASRGTAQAEIEAMYRDALERHPGLHDVRGVLAKLDADRGDRLAGVQRWEGVLAGSEAEHDADVLLGAARSMLQLGERTRAAQLALRASKLPEVSPETMLAAAGVLSQTEEVSTSVELTREAARRSVRTSHGSTLVSAAHQLATLGRADGAAELAAEGARVALSRGRHLGQADTLYGAGTILINLNKAEEGLALVRQAADIMQGSGWDAVPISRTLMQYGVQRQRPEHALRAKVLMDGAVAAEPDDPMLLLEHAQACYGAGDKAGALASMKAAAEIGTRSAVLADRYAALLAEQGKHQDAAFWKEQAKRRLSP